MGRLSFNISDTVYHSFSNHFLERIFHKDELIANSNNDVKQEKPYICVTRNPAYLFAFYKSIEKYIVRLTLDGKKLSYNHKAITSHFSPDYDEYEEQIFGDIKQLHKYIKRIDIIYKTKPNDISEKHKKTILDYANKYKIPVFLIKCKQIKPNLMEFKYSDTQLLYNSKQIGQVQSNRNIKILEELFKKNNLYYTDIVCNELPKMLIRIL